MFSDTHSWCGSSPAEGFRWRGASSCTYCHSEPAPDFHSRLRNIRFPADREICWYPTMKYTSKAKWCPDDLWTGVCFGTSCWSEGPRCEHNLWLIFWSVSELSDPSTWWCPARYKVATLLMHILHLPLIIIHIAAMLCRRVLETSQSTNITLHATYDRMSPPAGHGNNACLAHSVTSQYWLQFWVLVVLWFTCHFLIQICMICDSHSNPPFACLTALKE